MPSHFCCKSQLCISSYVYHAKVAYVNANKVNVNIVFIRNYSLKFTILITVSHIIYIIYSVMFCELKLYFYSVLMPDANKKIRTLQYFIPPLSDVVLKRFLVLGTGN